MMTFLLVVHGLLALALVGVILMQKSEGGGLTGGGSAGGLVSARGAADLLTRTTAILAALFIISSLGLAMLANADTSTRPIDTSLAREAPPIASDLPAAPAEPAPAAAPVTAPEATNDVPLAQ